FNSGQFLSSARLVLKRLKAQRFLTLVVLGLAYYQLVLGASMRHVSESADPTYFRVLVWFHLIGAAGTALATVALWLAPRCPTPGLSKPRLILLALVGVQIGLGLGTWVMKYNFPEWFGSYVFAQSHRIVNDDFYQVQIVTAHVAVGSLILGLATFLLIRLWRAEYCLWAVVDMLCQESQRVALGERPQAPTPPRNDIESESLTPC
ncbi:MAG: hypothetical protein Q8M16_05070, partial [Pirellulaceae bacterium]|nr:hypothetical protein [Pirellulaceae bacterium]